MSAIGLVYDASARRTITDSGFTTGSTSYRFLASTDAETKTPSQWNDSCMEAGRRRRPPLLANSRLLPLMLRLTTQLNSSPKPLAAFLTSLVSAGPSTDSRYPTSRNDALLQRMNEVQASVALTTPSSPEWPYITTEDRAVPAIACGERFTAHFRTQPYSPSRSVSVRITA